MGVIKQLKFQQYLAVNQADMQQKFKTSFIEVFGQ